MSSPSFIDIVDALSPLVTMGFGIYCAVNDTKPKDGKLSKGGKVALWGLIISGLITVVIKVSELNGKIEERQAKIVQQEIEKRDKDSTIKANKTQDSITRIFERTTIDSLSRSIQDLSNIKSASEATLNTLDLVTEEQKAALLNTRRGLNPLYPMKVALDYYVNLDHLYRENQNVFPADRMKKIEDYIKTMVYYTAIQQSLGPHRYHGERIDTAKLPRLNEVMLFHNSVLPDSVIRRFKQTQSEMETLMTITSFSINLRRNNKVGSLKNRTSLKFAASHPSYYEISSLDLANNKLHMRLEVGQPGRTSQVNDDFVSLFDLQNSIIGFEIHSLRAHNSSIFQLNEIIIYTGFDFSRETSLKFEQSHVKDVREKEVYARKINPVEVK